MPEILAKISDGNPGALNVCVRLLKDGAEIDPDDALGPLGAILQLDSIGIYGSRVWMLYKDVCGQRLPEMVALLRATQLGFLSPDALDHAISNYGDGIMVDDMMNQVQERLPKFNAKIAV